MSRNTGPLLSMFSGPDEITRKEIGAWSPQAKGRMLLSKSMNCLSFYLPIDHRGGGLAKEKSLRSSVWGLVLPCLWTGGCQPLPQKQRDTLNPGGFLYVENISHCSIQEPETTLGILSRKGFNAGN